MFGNHGLCSLPEEGAREKSPKCLGGNLGDFGGGFCKGFLLSFIQWLPLCPCPGKAKSGTAAPPFLPYRTKQKSSLKDIFQAALDNGAAIVFKRRLKRARNAIKEQ
ncbi:hypothetical protein [Neisseria cinerea]